MFERRAMYKDAAKKKIIPICSNVLASLPFAKTMAQVNAAAA